MKKTIKVTVNYPVTFELEIDSEKNLDEVREYILDEAAHFKECHPSEPIIQFCEVLK